jgi:hypothetical protein
MDEREKAMPRLSLYAMLTFQPYLIFFLSYCKRYGMNFILYQIPTYGFYPLRMQHVSIIFFYLLGYGFYPLPKITFFFVN